MGAPVLVGAGIGAATSLAMGRDPLMGAALGGLSGGAFGGVEGFGSGFAEGGLFDLGSAATNVGANSLNAGSGLLSGAGTTVGTDMAASTIPQFGAVQGAEFMPNVLVDSAYNAPIANPYAYTGDLSMMSSMGEAQTFPLVDPGYAVGGGYDPRLGVSQLDKIYQPDFTAIPMGNTTMSGGGAAPGGSFADKMTKALSDSISGISASDAASGAVSAYNQLTPQQQQQLQPIIEQQLPSNPELVAQAKMGNILDVKTEADKYKKRNLFYPTRTFA